MPISRHFHDWTQPGLPAAAKYLQAQAPPGPATDLSQWIVVLPGARAGRRLLQLLTADSDRRGAVLLPPTIVTPGALPETLYLPQRPFATPLAQRLAWVAALQQLSADALGRLVAGRPADNIRETWAQESWLELADLVRHQHRELAAEGLNFSDLVRATRELGQPRESERWTALRELQLAYFQILDEAALWDRQTARLEAIDRRECATEKQLLLLSVVDLNAAVRKMLDQVADQVTAWILAPPALAERFDSHGCLDVAAWQKWSVDFPENALEVADAPADQARHVARALSAWCGSCSAKDVAVGLCDERLAPMVQRHLESFGVASRWGPGRSLQESPPAILLKAVADFLSRPCYRALASLVRHADLIDWLASRGHDPSWLVELDQYYERHLPDTVAGLRETFGRQSAGLSAAMLEVEMLLDGLLGPDRPLEEWQPQLAELLLNVYGGVSLEAENDAATATAKLLSQLDMFASLPARLRQAVPAVTAVRLWLQDAAAATLPAPEDDAAVEMLGWLELPLDTARYSVLTSLNEGFVPTSLTSDLFLPDAVRKELGLEDNRHRFARDAYALSAVLASRAEVRLISGRRDVDRNPLRPSRLLFGGDPDRQARLAKRLFDPQETDAPVSPFVDVLQRHAFAVPRPEPIGETIESLRVTQFKDYLSCPYRFYLRHVCQLQRVNDACTEMQATAFGTLMHEVLRQFAAHEEKNSETAETIRKILRTELDRCARRRYGRLRLPAVALQIEQLRRRLDRFAEVQAEQARGGWQIRYHEAGPAGEAPFPVDGQPFGLRGRIDRIDWNPSTNEWALWDYKSSETATTPEKAHRNREGWVDLQLPLYRHLATAMGLKGRISLGYIMLPKDTDETKFLAAGWSEEDLTAADTVAEQVIRNLRQEVFWPPTDLPPQFATDWEAICQDRVPDRETRHL